MTIQELETMLTTISRERMGEVLTMKIPEDKTSELSNNISTITQRLDKLEKINNQEKEVEQKETIEEATNNYFKDLLK